MLELPVVFGELDFVVVMRVCDFAVVDGGSFLFWWSAEYGAYNHFVSTVRVCCCYCFEGLSDLFDGAGVEVGEELVYACSG